MEPATFNSLTLDEIARRQTVGGTDHVSEVVGMFREEAESVLPRLAASLERGDLADLARQAHSLKGSCGYIGGERMLATTRELERAAKEGAEAEVQDRLLQLIDDYDTLRVALEDYLMRHRHRNGAT